MSCAPWMFAWITLGAVIAFGWAWIGGSAREPFRYANFSSVFTALYTSISHRAKEPEASFVSYEASVIIVFHSANPSCVEWFARRTFRRYDF